MKIFFLELKNELVLASYVTTLSRLSGCLQFMQAAENQEDDEDSDDEDMKTNLFKAAEQDVIDFSNC